MAAFYTLLYIADPSDAARLGCEEDAAERWPSLWLERIGDQELVGLWAALTDSSSAPAATVMDDLLFQAGDAGPYVVRVSPAFVAAMAAVPNERVPDAAEAWGRTAELTDWRPDELINLVGELREFAQRAAASGQAVLQVVHL